MLDVLQPFFRDDWLAHGESLRLLEAPSTRPSIARWVADPRQLEDTLVTYAAHLHSTDEPRAVASVWLLHYLGVLLPPMVALCSLVKHFVPAGWDDMSLTLHAHGAAKEFAIVRIGAAAPEADTQVRYHALIWQHLQPLLSLLNAHCRVPRRILWGNVSRTFIGMFGHARQRFHRDASLAAAIDHDRRRLLESPLWPDGRRNPLFLQRRQITVPLQGRARVLTLHASCCLAYRLRGTGYCGACPLPKARDTLIHPGRADA